MATEVQAKAFSAATVGGFTNVFTSAESAHLAADTNTLASVTIGDSATNVNLNGKKVLCGFKVTEAFAQNGTASAAGTATFTFGDTEFDDQNDGQITLISTDGTSRTYTAKNAVCASATATISNHSNLASSGGNLVFIATDGTSVTATVHASTTTTTDTTSPTFAAVTSNNQTATNLATCLNANSRFRASADSAVVTVHQLFGGTAGNTTVAETDSGSGMSKTNFTGGADLDASQGEFACDVDATNAAERFEEIVESATNGHNTGSTTRFAVTTSGGQVTITQSTVGAAGNTSITSTKNFDLNCDVNPPTAFTGGVDAGTPNLDMQGSFDGTNFFKIETVIADLDLTNTGIKAGIADLSTFSGIPFTRLAMNSNGVDIGTTSAGKGQFQFAVAVSS